MQGWHSWVGCGAVVVALSSVSDRSAYGVQNPPAQSHGPQSLVVCTGTVENQTREYALQRITGPNGPAWQLTMQGGPAGKNAVTLPLPRAVPEIAADHVALSYKTANGGRQVTLAAGPGASTVDVYVDFGLEVNVDANLDPRVDEMNTHGSVPVRCTINAGAASPNP
jgi:hypothetical protein